MVSVLFSFLVSASLSGQYSFYSFSEKETDTHMIVNAINVHSFIGLSKLQEISWYNCLLK